MKRYRVTYVPAEYTTRVYEVEANSEDEAWELAREYLLYDVGGYDARHDWEGEDIEEVPNESN